MEGIVITQQQRSFLLQLSFELPTQSLHEVPESLAHMALSFSLVLHKVFGIHDSLDA